MSIVFGMTFGNVCDFLGRRDPSSVLHRHPLHVILLSTSNSAMITIVVPCRAPFPTLPTTKALSYGLFKAIGQIAGAGDATSATSLVKSSGHSNSRALPSARRLARGHGERGGCRAVVPDHLVDADDADASDAGAKCERWGRSAVSLGVRREPAQQDGPAQVPSARPSCRPSSTGCAPPKRRPRPPSFRQGRVRRRLRRFKRLRLPVNFVKKFK
jgi:hypothetical protein